MPYLSWLLDIITSLTLALPTVVSEMTKTPLGTVPTKHLCKLHLPLQYVEDACPVLLHAILPNNRAPKLSSTDYVLLVQAFSRLFHFDVSCRKLPLNDTQVRKLRDYVVYLLSQSSSSATDSYVLSMLLEVLVYAQYCGIGDYQWSKFVHRWHIQHDGDGGLVHEGATSDEEAGEEGKEEKDEESDDETQPKSANADADDAPSSPVSKGDSNSNATVTDTDSTTLLPLLSLLWRLKTVTWTMTCAPPSPLVSQQALASPLQQPARPHLHPRLLTGRTRLPLTPRRRVTRARLTISSPWWT